MNHFISFYYPNSSGSALDPISVSDEEAAREGSAILPTEIRGSRVTAITISDSEHDDDEVDDDDNMIVGSGGVLYID